MLRKYSTLLLILISCYSFAQSDKYIPERPDPPHLINNLSKEMPDFLSSGEEAQLEKKLQDFANETSNQIVVVIVDDMGGLEAFDYATRLGQKWGVGQEKSDNGVVILIKPTGGEGERDLFIAPGYGLQGAIPDLTTKQIRENEMYPYLKNGENFKAIDNATNVIMALAKGEYNSDAYGAKNGKGKFPMGVVVPLIIIIIFIIIRLGRGGRGGGMTMGASGIFFGGSSFGGGFGGSSSGGFGGFGGGGFGGGGSGGKW